MPLRMRIRKVGGNHNKMMPPVLFCSALLLPLLAANARGDGPGDAVFSVRPANQTCDVDGAATFHCVAAYDDTPVWLVNGENTSSLSGFQATITGSKAVLQVKGCSRAWNGYHIQCVISSTGRASFSSAYLTVGEESVIRHFFVTCFQQYKTLLFGVGLGLVLGLALCLILSCFCCCCCFSRKRRSHREEALEAAGGQSTPMLKFSSEESYSVSQRESITHRKRGGSFDERSEERLRQEVAEQKEASRVVQYHLPKRYKLESKLPVIGSRLQKYWFVVHDEENNKDMILTRTPISKVCRLTLNNEDTDSHVQRVNTLLKEVQVPSVLGVQEIFPDPTDDKYVLVVQPLMRGGSLKDLIHKTSSARLSSRATASLKDWAEKYITPEGEPLPREKVVLYGRQILETLLYLYGKGFPPLGHVQTSNIFVDGDVCRLGGYENTLLGYRSRLYRIIEEKNLPDIDVIMFGHVMYEMCSGRELSGVFPSDDVLAGLASEDYRIILQYIFTKKRDGSLKHSIKDISRHSFFHQHSHTGELLQLLRQESREDTEEDLTESEGEGKRKKSLTSSLKNLLPRDNKRKKGGFTELVNFPDPDD